MNGLARDALQEGIYFRQGEVPPRFFSIVFLRLPQGVPKEVDARETLATAVIKQIADLWGRYEDLKRGRVYDLEQLVDQLWGDEAASLAALSTGQGSEPDYAAVPPGELRVLLAFGVPLFDLVLGGEEAAPEQLRTCRFQAPVNEGTAIYLNSRIPFEGGSTDLGCAAVAVQFTADTLLAVERAIVETWKYLQDNQAGLEVQAAYTGARRADGRSWIDFHDGPSNLGPWERRNVIEVPLANWRRVKTLSADALHDVLQFVPQDADEWTAGGTYLAFMRLYIDLNVWRSNATAEQESRVGRRKLSGLPLCTVTGTFPDARAFRRGDSHYVEPQHSANPAHSSSQLDKYVAKSHIQLANLHNPRDGGSLNPMNRRIFRQGYPFFEPFGGARPFRVGLNFVSFQWTPAALLGIVGSWLGGTNFGGEEDGDPMPLLSAGAAGFFLAPPWAADDAFPGERALTNR